MVSLLHALHRYSYFLVTRHFFLTWTLSLMVVVVCGLLLSTYSDRVPRSYPSGMSDRRPKPPRQFTFVDGLCAVVFALFLAAYIATIFYKADFALYDDNEIFTDYSVRGTPYPPHILYGAGRFIPLALQEFNVLGHFTRSVGGYYSFVAVELVVVLVLMFVILEEVSIRLRFLILAAAMLVPSFVISFTGLIFPERDLLFWLAIMLLCLHRYSKTKARIYFLGTLVTAQFALYYKEPMVVLLAVWAISRAFIQLYTEYSSGHRSWRESLRSSSLSLGMLGVCVIYTAFFVVALLPRGNFGYIRGQRVRFGALGVAPQSLLVWHLLIDWLPLILLVVFSARVARFIFSRGKLDPVLEPLAASALAYYLCLLAIRIGNAYYIAPVDFIAVIYLALVSLAWLRQPSTLRVAILAVTFGAIMFHNALYSSFQVVDRKSVMAGKAQFVDFLRKYLPTAKGDTVELFFPYAYGYDVMGLSAYLRNKGFQLDGPFAYSQASGEERQGPRLIIEGRDDFADNKCVPYRDYACHHAESARPGALIVVLPDDNASMADVEHIGENATLMLDWKGPVFCTRENSWFRLLHAVSIRYPRNALPEHWLQLHVFRADVRDAGQ